MGWEEKVSGVGDGVDLERKWDSDMMKGIERVEVWGRRVVLSLFS
jgi:hypothetical protein